APGAGAGGAAPAAQLRSVASVTVRDEFAHTLMEQTSGDCNAHQNKDGGTNVPAPTARPPAYPVAELEADFGHGKPDPGDEQRGHVGNAQTEADNQVIQAESKGGNEKLLQAEGALTKESA